VGAQAGTDLAKYLADKNPDVRNAALKLKATIEADTKASTGPKGAAAGKDLADYLAAKDPDVRKAAQKLKAAIEADVVPATKPIGTTAGTDLASGLASTEGANKGAAQSPHADDPTERQAEHESERSTRRATTLRPG
jgi:hypothetical protein